MLGTIEIKRMCGTWYTLTKAGSVHSMHDDVDLHVILAGRQGVRQSQRANKVKKEKRRGVACLLCQTI